MLQADWLKDAPDDLDVFVAQRDFENAMELIEKSTVDFVFQEMFFASLRGLRFSAKSYLSGLSENHAVRDIRYISNSLSLFFLTNIVFSLGVALTTVQNSWPRCWLRSSVVLQ